VARAGPSLILQLLPGLQVFEGSTVFKWWEGGGGHEAGWWEGEVLEVFDDLEGAEGQLYVKVR